jgi:hypothetical protein
LPCGNGLGIWGSGLGVFLLAMKERERVVATMMGTGWKETIGYLYNIVGILSV